MPLLRSQNSPNLRVLTSKTTSAVAKIDAHIVASAAWKKRAADFQGMAAQFARFHLLLKRAIMATDAAAKSIVEFIDVLIVRAQKLVMLRSTVAPSAILFLILLLQAHNSLTQPLNYMEIIF